MRSLAVLFEWMAQTHLYYVAVGFIALYPIVTSVVWTLTAILFYRRNEITPLRSGIPEEELPFVSLLVAAYCEEAVIERTVESLLAIDYPKKEIVIVDDGSSDSTISVLKPYADAGLIRLVEKRQNEGKAMALNDAIPLLRGEIVAIIDADIQPRPNVLRFLVPHFESGRVAAVTGNPQVANSAALLAKLQATEFASIVSVLRRAQRVWGRVLTVSGAIAAFR